MVSQMEDNFVKWQLRKYPGMNIQLDVKYKKSVSLTWPSSDMITVLNKQAGEIVSQGKKSDGDYAYYKNN